MQDKYKGNETMVRDVKDVESTVAAGTESWWKGDLEKEDLCCPRALTGPWAILLSYCSSTHTCSGTVLGQIW